ncbi:glycosyltransferase family 8 protein [Aaosphaeria arxii CBS 175.79]|uniref:Glycosyltransferase family 8 protein n=1 Tax=Aaosphaeria arxii CBS 175.79 TaxID=1450172 RepID=A0A6A5Y4S2_9PLEO|nr:glycosyltransferase family 8 protein [Aaosphaeria arxii CBS 175.79]KAF2019514.1 glycosyltransferase family 8 protein [Aaosphaeria arxii CBS 175.79]
MLQLSQLRNIHDHHSKVENNSSSSITIPLVPEHGNPQADGVQPESHSTESVTSKTRPPPELPLFSSTANWPISSITLEIPAAFPVPTKIEIQNDESTSSNIPIPTETVATVFEAEFPFQNDLDLDFPSHVLKALSNEKPYNYPTNGKHTYAYATFMATRNPSIKDPYFMAIHSLIYRVLWSPRSRSEGYPFIVFVGDFVTMEQRELLAGAGAIVRELAPLEWNPNTPGAQHRWKDLFAKLNMWKETEFSRILFLDADAFPTTNIDDMFELGVSQHCLGSNLEPDDYLLDGSPVCEPYVFAGVPQNPFNETNRNINVGSMVFSPSERMHQRLLQNYVKTDRYDCMMAEQAFLNWQFAPQGAFPATQLDRAYGGFFPQEDEEGKLKVIHEKLWADDRMWMKREWLTQWEEMIQFYTSPAFLESRAASLGLFETLE